MLSSNCTKNSCHVLALVASLTVVDASERDSKTPPPPPPPPRPRTTGLLPPSTSKRRSARLSHRTSSRLVRAILAGRIRPRVSVRDRSAPKIGPPRNATAVPDAVVRGDAGPALLLDDRGSYERTTERTTARRFAVREHDEHGRGGALLIGGRRRPVGSRARSDRRPSTAAAKRRPPRTTSFLKGGAFRYSRVRVRTCTYVRIIYYIK